MPVTLDGFVSSFATAFVDGATSEQFTPLDHRFTTTFDPFFIVLSLHI
jgi:hypothetical protein